MASGIRAIRGPIPKRMKAETLKTYEKEYTAERLHHKLGRIARQAGLRTVYAALLLYYAYQRKETPAWAKRIILGALGYLISPIDMLPDLTPFLGYTDDLGVLAFGLTTIACYINDEVRQRARTRLQRWFGTYDEADLRKVDDAL